MATSGTITQAIRTGYQLKLVWNVDSQSIPNNTSSVTVKVQLVSTGSSYTINSSATKYGTLYINGVSYSFTFSASLSGNQTKTLFTKTAIVTHSTDGSKTCAFRADCGINVTLSGVYYGTVTVSGNGTFNTIPRATTPVLSTASPTMGNAITITLNRASSAFTHTLTYAFGSASGTIATGAGTSASWNVPLSLANQIPNATSGTGTITCKTYNGSSLVGTKSVSFTASVPASVVPTITAVSHSEAVSGIASKFGAYVQTKSKVAVSITAAGAYSSTIKTYSATVDGATYGTATFTTSEIKASGTVPITVTVTDSRGRKASTTQNITVRAYSPPKITTISAFRCNDEGIEDYEGEYLSVELNFSISTVNNLNDKYYEIVYREKGEASWSSVQAGNVYALNTTVLSGAVFDVDYSYDLALNVYDYFEEAHATMDIPTAFTLVDFRSTGKGLALGKVSEQDGLEIAIEVIQEDRQTPTLLNSWVNYGSSYESASYWKDKCNVVHLSGLIKGGTTTAETVIFTLPTGYTPRNSEKFFAVSVNAICVIDVYSSGNVAIKTGANSGWLSLSGISFRAN